MSALDELIRRASGEKLPKGFDSARGRVDIVDFPAYDEASPFDLGYTLFISNSVPTRRTAYDTIINTGGLGILRNPGLVQEIQKYYAAVATLRSFEAIMEGPRTRFTETQRRQGISPVDEFTMDELAERFRDSNDMLTAGKEYWLFTNFHLRLLHQHQETANRIAATIENAIR